MKKQPKKQVTYPTRIKDKNASEVLDALGEFLAPITRKTFVNLVKGEKITKSALHEEYNIPNRYGYGIKKDVEARLDSYIECLKLNQEQLEGKITSLQKKLKKTKNLEARTHLETKIHHKEKKLKKVIEELQTKNYSYTFGSKKLFRAQFHLKKNGYKSHQEWLADWRLSRNYNFSIIGSSGESYGNQNCQLIPKDDGNFSLQLRIPDGLIAIWEKKSSSLLERLDRRKYLFIENLKLPKNEKKRTEILRGFNFLRKMITEDLRAITVRFHKDRKGWIFAATTAYDNIIPITLDTYGVIGVDINQDHLAVTETDASGNPINSFKIALELDGLSSNARENLINHKVLELVNYARERGKDLVIEELNFAKKKRELGVLYGPDYARMLSSFAYRQISDRIIASAYFRGVKVHIVNPAYSSLIGRFKFSERYGLSVHQAAALVIARRYLGLSERLPKSVAAYVYRTNREKVVLEKPAASGQEDSTHPWKRWAKLQRQINNFWTQKKRRTKDPPIEKFIGRMVDASLEKESESTEEAVVLGST